MKPPVSRRELLYLFGVLDRYRLELYKVFYGEIKPMHDLRQVELFIPGQLRMFHYLDFDGHRSFQNQELEIVITYSGDF